MMASDEPSAKSPKVAGKAVKFDTTRPGSQTRLKPAITIMAWPMIAITPRKLLNAEDTLMPRTFIQTRTRMPASVSSNQNQCTWVGPM